MIFEQIFIADPNFAPRTFEDIDLLFQELGEMCIDLTVENGTYTLPYVTLEELS